MEIVGLMVLFPAAMFGVVIFAIWWTLTSRTDAKKAYEAALAQYRQSPHDPHLREVAMSKGRVYSRWSRNSYGVASFDEFALKNDLDEVAAAATPSNSSGWPVASLEGRLAALADLYDRGVISAEERDTRRREILREI